MKLNDIRDNSAATRARRRVGRGIGSGTGKTAGSGHKGQKSRSGVSINGFEGGQMPIHRRLPKRGFKNIFRKRYEIVNIGLIQVAVDEGRLDAKKTIDAAALQAAGLIGKPRDGVRLLGKGEIKAKINVDVTGASASAIASVEKAGGKVNLSQPASVDKKGADKSADKNADKKAKKPAPAQDSAPEASAPEDTPPEDTNAGDADAGDADASDADAGDADAGDSETKDNS